MAHSLQKEADLTARFDEFETIDWIEEARNEISRKKAKFLVQTSSFYFALRSLYNLVQVWLVIFLVGSAIGTITAFISIVTEWLSDIKLGYCSKNWWLNEKFCCWENWNT
ncbi:hypothetical protein BB560_006620, partial [Smittium megazygosporum]